MYLKSLLKVGKFLAPVAVLAGLLTWELLAQNPDSAVTARISLDGTIQQVLDIHITQLEPVDIRSYLSSVNPGLLLPAHSLRTEQGLEFKPVSLSRLGPDQANTWFRLALKNTAPTQQQVMLSIPSLFLADVELVYWLDGRMVEERRGVHSHSRDTPYEVGQLVMPIRVAPASTQIVFFRIASLSSSPFHPMLGQAKAIDEALKTENRFRLILTGLIAGLVMNSLMAIFIIGRSRQHQYYLLSALLQLIFILYSQGWLLDAMATQLWFHEKLYSLLLSAALISQTQFSRHLFATWRQAPYWDRWLLLVIAIGAINAIIGLIIPTGLHIRVMGGLFAPLLLSMTIMSLVFWRRAYNSARIYAVAMLAFFAMVAVSVAGLFDLLPFTTWVRESYRIGIVAQLLFFGLATANQIRTYRDEQTHLLVATEVAKKESAAKSEFVARMSHELRTPLNGVIGMAQLLNNTEQSELQRYYSQTIINSGNILLSQISDILDLNQIIHGDFEIEHKPFDLDAATNECLAIFHSQLIEKRYPLFIRIDPEMPIKVLGDEARFKQIVINLVANALTFTHEGRIDLEVTLVKNPQGLSEMEIVVSDTGIGVDAEKLNEIFELFRQPGEFETAEHRGSGLGLAITKAIVEKMGGHISVHSIKGQGSKFVVRLPLSADKNSELIRYQKMRVLKGKRALFVCRFDTTYEIFTSHFRYWGMQVTRAETHTEAIELLNAEGSANFDLIITYLARGDKLWAVHEPYQPFKLPIYCMHLEHSKEPQPEKLSYIRANLLPQAMNRIMYEIIELFAADDKSTEGRSAVSEYENLSHLNVLLAEDNPTNRAVAMGMLRYWNIMPDIAEDGQQACQLYQTKRHSLIFMDCDMPRMNGFDASRAILNDAIGAVPPTIIALTAHALTEQHEKCYQYGMSEVLTKPLTVQELKLLFEKLGLDKAG